MVSITIQLLLCIDFLMETVASYFAFSSSALYELVDQLPYRHDKWYYHFLLVLLNEGFDVVFKLEPCLLTEKETLTNLEVNNDSVELISGIVEAAKTRESQVQPPDKAEDKVLDKKGGVETESDGELLDCFAF